MPRQFLSRRVSSFKAIGLIAVLATAFAGYILADTTGFNIMTGDAELLRLKNQTDNTPTWSDPVSADAGERIRFLVYYHCSTDAPNWSEVRANNTKVRIEFPKNTQGAIVTTGKVSATGLTTVTNTGTINVSSLQKLTFFTTASWYPGGGSEQTLPVTIGDVDSVTSYAEVNLGSVSCDYLSGTPCYAQAGQLVFTADVSSIFPAPTVNLIIATSQNGSYGDGPISIISGNAAFLRWSTTNVSNTGTPCTASGSWSGTKASSETTGISTGSLTSTSTFTITCTGLDGTSVSDSVTANVIGPPTVDLRANNSNGPITINNNTAATLSWATTNNPTNCTATCVSGNCGNWISQVLAVGGGSWLTENLTAISRTYGITCSNSAGSASDNVLVQVLYCLPAPPTAPI